MSNTTQILTRDAAGVTFADPLSPDFTVRFKTQRSSKGLNGISLDNFLTEIIVNDDLKHDVGQVTVIEPLSVRIRVSGSMEAQGRLQAMLQSIATQIPSWTTEHVFIGFEPVTAPSNPA